MLRPAFVLIALAACGGGTGRSPSVQPSTPPLEMSPRQSNLQQSPMYSQQPSTLVSERQLVSGRDATPEDLLAGLAAVDPVWLAGDVEDPDAIIDVREELGDLEARRLVQTLDTGPAAPKALQLTIELRQRGLLAADERIVGYHDGELYKISY